MKLILATLTLAAAFLAVPPASAAPICLQGDQVCVNDGGYPLGDGFCVAEYYTSYDGEHLAVACDYGATSPVCAAATYSPSEPAPTNGNVGLVCVQVSRGNCLLGVAPVAKYNEDFILIGCT